MTKIAPLAISQSKLQLVAS